MSIARTDALQISRRYATAIFALAVEANKEQQVVGEMAVLGNAITANAELNTTLNNPIITREQKAAVLDALVSKADIIARRAVATIAKGGRAELIPTIVEQLDALLTKHLGQVEAVVTSARALPPATQKQLLQSLAKATGKTVQLKLVEDASVLGGLSIQLGSLRLDATLAGALNQMREQLLAPTH